MVENLARDEQSIDDIDMPICGSCENIVSFLDKLDSFKRDGAGIIRLAQYFTEVGLEVGYDTMHMSADSERRYASMVLSVGGSLGDGTAVDISLRQTDSSRIRNGRNYRQSVGVSGLLDENAMHLRESWDLASSRRLGREGSGLHMLKEGFDPVDGSEHYQTFMRHEHRC